MERIIRNPPVKQQFGTGRCLLRRFMLAKKVDGLRCESLAAFGVTGLAMVQASSGSVGIQVVGVGPRTERFRNRSSE
ncbi:hypothetical protein [Anatilimnocola aggregata]|nr:hypothetical protein [Anatilimnocola aggregata]